MAQEINSYLREDSTWSKQTLYCILQVKQPEQHEEVSTRHMVCIKHLTNSSLNWFHSNCKQDFYYSLRAHFIHTEEKNHTTFVQKLAFISQHANKLVLQIVTQYHTAVLQIEVSLERLLCWKNWFPIGGATERWLVTRELPIIINGLSWMN